ncbi:MAG: 30S ribosomal protein S20 [Pseudomonadota bacterium]
MANHKSALKRARQSEDRRLRNKAVKTRVKNITKDMLAATAETAADDLKVAQSVIDKAAKKGVIHPRTASRKIARLTKIATSKTA